MSVEEWPLKLKKISLAHERAEYRLVVGEEIIGVPLFDSVNISRSQAVVLLLESIVKEEDTLY